MIMKLLSQELEYRNNFSGARNITLKPDFAVFIIEKPVIARGF